MPNTFVSKENFRENDDWLERKGGAVTVSAGAPGSFSPAGFQPDSLTALRALGALGQSTTWSASQYVVLDDGSRAFWDGDSWELPVVTGVTNGTPGAFTPANAAIPQTLTATRALGALGESTAWSTGQYVLTGNGTHIHWDGDSWESGDAP